MMSCLAYKLVEKRGREEDDIQSHGICLLKWPLHMMKLCFPRNGWTPAYQLGSSEIISCFVLLVCTAFALAIKVSLSQSMSFLTFAFSILSPIPKLVEPATLCMPVPLCWWQAWESAWQTLTKYLPVQWVKFSKINPPDDRGCASSDSHGWWQQLQSTFRLKAARGDCSCLQGIRRSSEHAIIQTTGLDSFSSWPS